MVFMFETVLNSSKLKLVKKNITQALRIDTQALRISTQALRIDTQALRTHAYARAYASFACTCVHACVRMRTHVHTHAYAKLAYDYAFASTC